MQTKGLQNLYSNSNCCIGIGNTTNLTSTKEANTECITFHQMWHMRSGNWGPKLNNKGNEHGFRVCHGNMAMAMNNDVKV